MKAVAAVLLILLVAGAGGYFGLPYLVERQTAGIRTEVAGLTGKVQKLEDFVSSEQEARKAARLEPGADAVAMIRGINGLLARVDSMEKKLSGEVSRLDTALKEQKAITASSLEGQADELEKEKAELRRQLGDVMYKAVVAQIRSHLLKIKTDLLAKNLGTADAEMDVAIGLLAKAKQNVPVDAGKRLEAYQASLRKARGEMSTDLPAAMKRIDLIWHELGK